MNKIIDTRERIADQNRVSVLPINPKLVAGALYSDKDLVELGYEHKPDYANWRIYGQGDNPRIYCFIYDDSGLLRLDRIF